MKKNILLKPSALLLSLALGLVSVQAQTKKAAKLSDPGIASVAVAAN